MTAKVMKLVDPYTLKMECKVCGAHHWANCRPNYRGGGILSGLMAVPVRVQTRGRQQARRRPASPQTEVPEFNGVEFSTSSCVRAA
jgi:hypothetical protein